jgi:predicted DNA-binding antitoxin AbrB/MazE fold protein
MSTVTAIYENGVFRPLDRVDLPEATRVHLTVDDSPSPAAAPASTALEKVSAALAWRYDGEPDDAARVDPARK